MGDGLLDPIGEHLRDRKALRVAGLRTPDRSVRAPAFHRLADGRITAPRRVVRERHEVEEDRSRRSALSFVCEGAVEHFRGRRALPQRGEAPVDEERAQRIPERLVRRGLLRAARLSLGAQRIRFGETLSHGVRSRAGYGSRRPRDRGGASRPRPTTVEIVDEFESRQRAPPHGTLRRVGGRGAAARCGAGCSAASPGRAGFEDSGVSMPGPHPASRSRPLHPLTGPQLNGGYALMGPRSRCS